MKKKSIKLIILILLVLILGFITVFYYFKDENDCTLKEYSPTGQLLGSTEYIIRNGDTVFQGKFLRFNDQGSKISEGQFKDNEPNGICSYYNGNGKLQAVHYRKNSKITLESTFYNSKGFIEKYVIYDNLGTPSFLINFDEKHVLKYEGYAIIETSLYGFSKKSDNDKHENLKVGDTLKYSYIIAKIPNTERSFKIENLDIDNSKVKRTQKHIPPAQIDVEEVLTKKGKNTIRSIVQYKFNDKVTPIYIDTLSFDVYVD